MKPLHSLLSVALISLSTIGLAQSNAPKSFHTMKTLAGTWQGRVSIYPPQKSMGDGALIDVSMRVTSRGNALLHEMQAANTPVDPAKYDHPVTMFYLDNGRLLLTHYCDAGNRPRMVGQLSADGKKVEFEFLDISGSTQYGHMDHAVFTIIDPNHHTEDWTYIEPGNKPMRVHIDLQRTK